MSTILLGDVAYSKSYFGSGLGKLLIPDGRHNFGHPWVEWLL